MIVPDEIINNSLITVEGPKCSGKSTFIEALQSELSTHSVYKSFKNTSFWKNGYQVSASGLDITQASVFMYDALLQIPINSRPKLIADRSMLSSYILNMDHDDIHSHYLKRLILSMQMIKQLGGIYLLILPNVEIHKSFMINRGMDTAMITSLSWQWRAYFTHALRYCCRYQIPLWRVTPDIDTKGNKVWEFQKLIH
jgi:thymidylate kinase